MPDLYRSVFDHSPLPKWIVRTQDHRILEANRAAEQGYGYSRDEFLGMDFGQLNFSEGGGTPTLHRRKDGSSIWMELHEQELNWQGEACLVVAGLDVGDRVRNEALNTLERDLMRRAMKPGADLYDIARTHALGLEAILPDLWVSILSVHDGRVFNMASPSLPTAFIRSIEGEPIGPEAGSCGTAAYLKQPVIVEDIDTAPSWRKYKAQAMELGLRACWSQPVCDSEGRVFATFAQYATTARGPNPHERIIFDRSASMLALVLEYIRKRQDLEAGNRRYQRVTQATQDAVFEWNVNEDHMIWADGFSRLFGYSDGLDHFAVSRWESLIHPDDREGIRAALRACLADAQSERWQCTYRFRKSSGAFAHVETFALIERDPFGRPTRATGVMSDISERVRLQGLLDTAGRLARIGSWEVDLVAQTLYWSPVTRAIHGVSDDFVPSLQDDINFYREDIREEVLAIITHSIETGAPWDFTYPLVRADGSECWVRAIGQTERIEGKTVRLFGSFQDISEFKRHVDEKTAILESIGDAFFAVDRNWVVTYWNHMAEVVLGKNRSDIVGRHLWTEYADAVGLEFYRAYHRAMDTGETVTFEEFYPTRNQWFEVTAYPSDRGLSVYFKDVTLRKTTAELIRQAKERFEMASNATQDAIWDWDIPARTLIWGGGYKTLFGYDPDDAEPTLANWSANVHPDDVDGVMESLGKAIDDPERTDWTAEYRYRRKDGSFAFVVDRGVVMRDASGKAIRMVGALSDITHRKQHEESLLELNRQLERRAKELAASNEELEQFAYVASHDLQEPLRMITSFLTQLQKRYDSQLDDRGRTYINFAVDGATRMRQIILDLLDFSRVGKTNAPPEPIALGNIVDEVVTLQTRHLRESGGKILVETDLPTVRTHRTAIMMVMQNLISNGVKYHKPGVPPVVRVRADRQGSDWVITVADNGIGIETEYFDRIFVLFQRLHAREAYSGTGIGLAIVKKQVETWGGRIWVESEPGQGSTFRFTLPEHAYAQ